MSAGASRGRTATPRRVVVLDARPMGASTQLRDALQSVRSACPEAHITLLGGREHVATFARGPAPVDDVQLLPYSAGVNPDPDAPRGLNLFLLQQRQEHYDLAVDLHGGRAAAVLLETLGARRTVRRDELDALRPEPAAQQPPTRQPGAPGAAVDPEGRPEPQDVDPEDVEARDVEAPDVKARDAEARRFPQSTHR